MRLPTTLSGYVQYGAYIAGGAILAAVCLLSFHSYRTEALAKEPVVATTTQNAFIKGSLDGVALNLELATTEDERAQGLGGRTSVPEGYGMLFIFPIAADYGFWMKGMQVPIDILWLDAQGQVIAIKENAQPDSYPAVFYPSSDATYVLEVANGFANAHSVHLGDTLKGLPSASDISK